MDDAIKKNKNTLPDMSDEVAVKFFLDTLEATDGYSDTIRTRCIISGVFSMLSCLNLLLFHFMKNLRTIQFFLLLVLLLPFSALWMYNLYKSCISVIKGLKSENKAKSILKDFPAVQITIDKICRKDALFARYYNYKDQNLFSLSIWLFMASCMPIIILIADVMQILKYEDLSISLSIIYFVIMSYLGIYGVLKCLKKKL
jgi:hypothetical protein